MFNSFKIYLAWCLIALQLVAPFIHAHAFGLDALSERAVHIHVDVMGAQTSQNLQSDTTFEQQTGYAVTVANGIVPQDETELLLSTVIGLAVLLSFSLLLKKNTRVIFEPLSPLFLMRLSYHTPNLRAPPH